MPTNTNCYLYRARFLIAPGKWREGWLNSGTKLRTNSLYIIKGVQTVPLYMILPKPKRRKKRRNPHDTKRIA